MSIRTIISGLLLMVAAITAGPSSADTLALNPDAPQRYVVVKGDTLWDISARFLRDPWLWPEIWYVNPEISNPHLIYPGDIVLLTYDKDGKPVLKVQRGGTSNDIKLSPEVRATPLHSAIPTIPLDSIRQFLNRPRVVTKEEFDKAPYIIAFQDRHLVAAEANKAYVRGAEALVVGKGYGIYRLGDAYRNPGSKEGDILGYETTQVADGRIDKLGDPASLLLTHSYRETLLGDRLFEMDTHEFDQNFMPHAPANPVSGKIIAVVDGVSRIGQYQVVVLNLGTNQGMEAGHVLSIHQAGETITDPIRPKKRNEQVTLPDEYAGLLMVFRAFEKVSYALIMEAERDIKIFDSVTQP